MSVSPGEVIRCAVRQTIGLADMINVYEFRHDGSSNVGNAQMLADVASYFDQAYNSLNTFVSNYVEPVDIKVDIVDVISGKKEVIENVGTVLWGSSYIPAASGERLPNGIAALVKLFTSRGKTYGRKFIGVFTETYSDGNEVVTALQTALATVVADLLSDLIADTTEHFTPGILSVNQTSPGTFYPFTEGSVNGGWSYQRRRKPSVGS